MIEKMLRALETTVVGGRRGRHCEGMQGLGVADRQDVREAVQSSVAKHKARLAKARFSQQLADELKEALKANTSLKPPARRKLPSQPPRGPKQRAARDR